MVGPESPYDVLFDATILGLKSLSDVQEMTDGLELEPFEFLRSPCQEMALQRPLCAAEDAASVRCPIETRLPSTPRPRLARSIL